MTTHPHKAKRPEDDEPEPAPEPIDDPKKPAEGEPLKTQVWELPG